MTTQISHYTGIENIIGITPISTPTIALVAETLDWHAKQLIGAIQKLGFVVKTMSLRDCAFDTEQRFGLVLPGFNDRLPDGVFVRTVPSGSFEQVTMRLGILHALSKLNVLIWNEARAIEACIDKSMTSFLLAKSGLPTPPTYTVQSFLAATAIVERELSEGHRLVAKPLFGAQGHNLKLIENVKDLPDEETVAGAYYLQRFITGKSRACDYRILVSSGSKIAGMKRIAPDSQWITNIKQGGCPEAVAISNDMALLAQQAASVTGAHYAGVDIIEDRDGTYMVLEVNSMPAWSGLQFVTSSCIADRICTDFIAAVQSHIL